MTWVHRGELARSQSACSLRLPQSPSLPQALCRLPQDPHRLPQALCRLPQDPHRLPQDPHRLPQALCRLPQDPHRLPQDPRRLPQDPRWLKQAPSRLLQAPSRLKQAPSRFKQAPSRLLQAPRRLKQAPSRLKQAPSRFKQAPSRLLQAPSRLKQAPSRFKEAPSRFKQAPSRLLQAPRRLLQAPRRLLQAPRRLLQAPLALAEHRHRPGMAKWGEGDPRWIVEERADATNVNNWHWTERDATPWSSEKLKSLLVGVTVEGEDGTCEITEVTKCDGEASINNRKGKLIFFYEWSLKASWTDILWKEGLKGVAGASFTAGVGNCGSGDWECLS
uniref:Activator of Hsp90 ATPase AHSA1-like N-terminal domain-containing protein n=1 Tax=Knipowitschia caucasica TaxID=637954 RepID=A0AAV2LWH3_KNICA